MNQLFDNTIKKIKIINDPSCKENENNFFSDISNHNIKNKFTLFIKNVKNFFVSIYREMVVFYRNTSLFYFLTICIFFIISIFAYLEKQKLQNNNSSGRIIPFSYLTYSDEFGYELLYGNLKSSFLVSFLHSITNGIIFSFITFIFLILIGCFDFFTENNSIKKNILKISNYCNNNSFILSILMFRYLPIESQNKLLVLFVATELFFKYCVIHRLFEKKKEIPFISFNLTRGVKKTHLIANSIIPHCKLDLVNIYISIFKSFLRYNDVFPSLIYSLQEMKTRSMYTFVFLLNSSFKTFLNEISIDRIPLPFAYCFVFFIFLTYFLLVMLLNHIRVYFIRKGIYEHK